ncbi:hypothetical protein ACTU45_32215 [Streptomyces sp. 24-1644]|uniref:hypothetical protein n=1 Tax=Streptomyces sp. 24-1644 TaxID=3457315 RepID=UPI003248E1B6
MNRRWFEYPALPVVLAVAVAAGLYLWRGGHYPLPVDLMALIAVALVVYVGTRQLALAARFRLEDTKENTPVPDTWKGKQLPDRSPVSDVDLHYRIYNARTGELLSFGTNGGPGSLNGIVQDALRTQQENPGVRLHVEQFDGPAYQ